MPKTVAAVLWRHLFTEGNDSCRLIETEDGFALEGRSGFIHENMPCSLGYRVIGDSTWQTRSARVSGFVGNETIDIEIGRTSGGDWLFNGALQSDVSGQKDLDLGFTPATNLIALRRFSLAIGEATDAPAAYLFFPEKRPPELGLTLMAQTYRRLDRGHYDYTGIDYHEVLTVSEVGFVLEYPRLWSGVLWFPKT